MRISDWSSDVCSSDLARRGPMPVSGEEFPMTKYAYQAAPWLALATCLAATPAYADEADSTIIVTAPQLTSEAEERAAKTAGGVDVVSHRDYADKSIVSLRDTLAFSPGVYVQPRYGQEVRI